MLWSQLVIVPDGPHGGYPLPPGLTGPIFRHAEAEIEEENVSSEDRSTEVVQDKVNPRKPTDTLTLKSKVLPQSVHAGADVSTAQTIDLGASRRGRIGGHTAQEVFSWRVAESVVMSEVAVVDEASEGERLWWRIHHVLRLCVFGLRDVSSHPAHYNVHSSVRLYYTKQ